jgi:hypothetical protein
MRFLEENKEQQFGKEVKQKHTPKHRAKKELVFLKSKQKRQNQSELSS